MLYLCLECGHKWDRDMTATYLQCPGRGCRSRDVVPASFWEMVEEGRRQGISHNTPLLDLIDAFKVVWGEESLLELGWQEFRRVMGRVIKEIEYPKHRGRLVI